MPAPGGLNYDNRRFVSVSNTANGEVGAAMLHETWQWSSGDGSRGQSVVEER